MRVRHLALIAAVSAALLAVVLGLSACASSGGASGLPSQVPAVAGYSSAAPASSFGLATNKRYGFSLRYPLGWVSATTSAAPGNPSGGALFSASWADPHGKLVQGHYVDALQVSVYALSKAVQPADLVTHSGDFKAIVDGLTKGLPMFAVSDPFRPITVNGTKGFQITYTYGIHSTPAGAMSYLLLKGRYAYWITGQATADTWSAAWAKLTPAMASFTIKAVKTK